MDKPGFDLSTGDYIQKVVKGGLGALPFVGALLGELLDMMIVPTHQKKMQEWFTYVDEMLHTLIQQGRLSKEQLFQDEEFIAILTKTSQIYSTTVEQHKKPLLQAFLKSAAYKTVPLDKKYIFLSILDGLTETHLLILRDIFDNEQAEHFLYQAELEKMLATKYADNNKPYLDLLIKGLQDYHLLSYWNKPFKEGMQDGWYLRTSSIAKEFMHYLLDE